MDQKRASRPGSTPSSIPASAPSSKRCRRGRTSTATIRSASTATTPRSPRWSPQFLYKHYFRVEAARRRERPARAACCSSRTTRGSCRSTRVGIGGAMLFEHDPPRIVRAMVEKYVQTLPFASLPVRALGPDHRHARELPPPARGRRGHPRLPRGRQGHLQAVHPALPAAGVRPRLHAPRARDQHADRARRGHRRRGAGARRST